MLTDASDCTGGSTYSGIGKPPFAFPPLTISGFTCPPSRSSTSRYRRGHAGTRVDWQHVANVLLDERVQVGDFGRRHVDDIVAVQAHRLGRAVADDGLEVDAARLIRPVRAARDVEDAVFPRGV